MTPKRVLNVGQCGFDQAGIARFLRQHFDVTVDAADDKDDALESLRAAHIDLVLVNRQLDADGSDGLAVIKAIKADPDFTAVPVMMVSNYADAHARAVAAGAVQGFGKAEYGDKAVVERLSEILSAEE